MAIRWRARGVLQAIRAAGGNAIVLTGDTHIAWANELSDAQGRVAVELGATSITSPSESSYFTQAGIDFAGGVRARNPHVKWLDGQRHGFLVLTLTQEQAEAEFVAVSTIDSRTYEAATAASFTIAAGEDAGIGPIVAA